MKQELKNFFKGTVIKFQQPLALRINRLS